MELQAPAWVLVSRLYGGTQFDFIEDRTQEGKPGSIIQIEEP